MTDWEWLTEPGTVGELPVRILENHRAEFILDFAENARIDEYTLVTDQNLSPGDVCILTAEIVDASTVRGQTAITVEVRAVELIRATETDTSRDGESSGTSAGGESTVQHMMKHLDDARDRRQREKDGNRCGNCRTVTGSTDVTVEERSDGRDLHYCDQCGRLLSTKEYRRWKDEHRW